MPCLFEIIMMCVNVILKFTVIPRMKVFRYPEVYLRVISLPASWHSNDFDRRVVGISGRSSIWQTLTCIRYNFRRHSMKTPKYMGRLMGCACLAAWFCYQVIVRPGNKTGQPLWPGPYTNYKIHWLILVHLLIWEHLGPDCRDIGYMVEMRPPYDRLVSTVGFPALMGRHLCHNLYNVISLIMWITFCVFLKVCGLPRWCIIDIWTGPSISLQGFHILHYLTVLYKHSCDFLRMFCVCVILWNVFFPEITKYDCKIKSSHFSNNSYIAGVKVQKSTNDCLKQVTQQIALLF